MAVKVAAKPVVKPVAKPVAKVAAAPVKVVAKPPVKPAAKVVPKKVAAPVAEAEAEVTEGGRGRKIMMPDGSESRVDYIRRRFFTDGAKRGEIAKELTAAFEKPIAYQIVFAATKTKKEDVAEEGTEEVVEEEETEEEAE
jgi:hypothetical protein